MVQDRAVQRIITKTTVECLWPYILALMKKDPIYAYELRDRISKEFGFQVGNVTAYMVLYKLESSGLVLSEWRNVENRQRKYYAITDNGRNALDDAIGCFQSTVDKLRG